MGGTPEDDEWEEEEEEEEEKDEEKNALPTMTMVDDYDGHGDATQDGNHTTYPRREEQRVTSPFFPWGLCSKTIEATGHRRWKRRPSLVGWCCRISVMIIW